jgi:predicted dehydrogenase
MKPSLTSCLFVGLGGAGQRHLRLFKDHYEKEMTFLAFRSKSTTPLLNSDFSVNTTETLETHYGLKMFDSLENALAAKPEYVVISTPTSRHLPYAIDAAKSGAHILLEKPFSDTLVGFDEFKALVIHNKSHFMLSFQRRFHPFSQKIKSIINQNLLGKISKVSVQVSSYVPEWHPYEDFRDLYACRKELGGGVLLTECHEIELCYWFFGLPTSLYCTGTSVAGLDVEDTVHLILNYDNFSINLNLSFMHQHAKRTLSFSGEKGEITCDFVNHALDVTYFDNPEASFSERNSVASDDLFIEQLHYFMKSFSFNESLLYLDTAEATMDLIMKAKKSMKEQKIQKYV